MSHQPFEEWILDGDALSADNRRALQHHLAHCPSCSRIQAGWQPLRATLRARPMLAPAPGFSQRWQVGLQARRAKEQRRQAWKIFGFFLITAILTGLALTGYMIATSSLSDWLQAAAQMFGSFAGIIRFLTMVTSTLLNRAPLGLTVVFWIYLTFCLFLLSAVWVAMIWRTSLLGVLNR